jgi:hypothetical protein
VIFNLPDLSPIEMAQCVLYDFEPSPESAMTGCATAKISATIATKTTARGTANFDFTK